MNRRSSELRILFFRRWALAALLLLGLGGQSALAAQPPQAAEAALKTMLRAIETDSLSEFIMPGDAAFRAVMTQERLNGVNRVLAPRLKAGYADVFLSTLHQHGFLVYIWKLQFKDGKDDILVTMPMKNGKVGGFWMR